VLKKISYLLSVPLLYILARIMTSKPETPTMQICVKNDCERFEDSGPGLASFLAKLLLLHPSSKITVNVPRHREEEIHQTLHNLNFTSFEVR
jgi:hypothetical protein